MKRRRYPRRRDSVLSQDLLEVLLSGWGALVNPDGDFSAFEVNLEHAWRQHRGFVLDVWKRRGGVGECWGAREFEGRGRAVNAGGESTSCR